VITTGVEAAALLAEAREYLEAHDVLTLATLDDGGAWATPLFYASDERLDLYVLSDPGTRHCAAIHRYPRVSAAVHDACRSWREITGLQLRGDAGPVADAALGAGLERYAAKFPFALGLCRPGGPHRLYRIRPTWLRLIDNARGLGAKRELHLAGGEP